MRVISFVLAATLLYACGDTAAPVEVPFEDAYNEGYSDGFADGLAEPDPPTEPKWEPVVCDTLEEQIGYGGVDDPGPRGSVRWLRAYIPVPERASVKVRHCGGYIQEDGVFRSETGHPFLEECWEAEWTPEDNMVNLHCFQENIQFDAEHAAEAGIPIYTVMGWEEIYILVEPETAL